jgi:hypothetical protein
MDCASWQQRYHQQKKSPHPVSVYDASKIERIQQSANPKFAERRDMSLVALGAWLASMRGKMGWRSGAMCRKRPQNEGVAAPRFSGWEMGAGKKYLSRSFALWQEMSIFAWLLVLVRTEE